jgi:hypothetical protein
MVVANGAGPLSFCDLSYTVRGKPDARERAEEGREKKEKKKDKISSDKHGRMARCDHELLKVLPVPAMPNPSTPRMRATPETTLQQGAGQVACGCLLFFWTHHALRLCR